MSDGDVPIQDLEEQMRELRKKGLSLREIAKTLGCSETKVGNVVKDVQMAIGIYHKELRAALVEGTIINLETTGTDSDKDEIITFGFLQHNVMTVIQRVEAHSSEFYDVITEKLSCLAHPVYAYDSRFHEAFLLAKLHLPIELVDIFEPWRQKALKMGLKYPTLDELASVPRQYFGEIVVPEREVRLLWTNYVKTKDKRKLAAVVRHCMEDLRQALYIMTFGEEQ